MSSQCCRFFAVDVFPKEPGSEVFLFPIGQYVQYRLRGSNDRNTLIDRRNCFLPCLWCIQFHPILQDCNIVFVCPLTTFPLTLFPASCPWIIFLKVVNACATT